MTDTIIRGSLNNRLLSIFLVLLICVFGYLAYRAMPVDVYPDLNAPLVNIVTENPGMSAEDVERLITIPLESTLNGSPGVTRIRSESGTGISVVTVEFGWDTDIYLARQIVSGKLELVSGQLPAGSSSPVLGPISSRMGEIFEFVLVSDTLDLMELRDLADWAVRYRLLSTAGVSYVVNLGGEVREYQVQLEPDQLRSYGIGIAEVGEAIAASNRNSTGGILTRREQEYLIRGIGQITGVEDIADIVVDNRDGVPVYVRNVAEVSMGPRFRRGSAGHNGRNAVKLTVEKQFRGDTLETIANVKATLDELRDELPAGVELYPFYDQSVFIEKAVGNIKRSILEGALLIVLVIMLFMGNLRSAWIAVVTIPYSIFIALLIMHLFGITINVMSLGGLAIGIGKMANSSIFVVENIYRKLLKNKGLPEGRRQGVRRICFEATREVAPALFSANLIIFLVFIPMFFMQGIEGKMFAPTAFAVGVALVGSFVGSITIKPVLASLFLRRITAVRESRVIRGALALYTPLLERAVDRPWRTLAAAGLVAGLIFALLLPRLGAEFMPQMDEGSIVASTVLLPGTSLEETARVGRLISAMVMDREKFPEVVSVTRETGRAEASEHAHPVSHSHFILELLPLEQRDRSAEEIIVALREAFDTVPGIHYIFEQPIQNKLAEMLTGTEGELSVKLFGPDLGLLEEKINELRDVLAAIEGVADLQVEQTAGVPRINIILDRQRMARYGIKVDDASDIIETALSGQEITDVYQGNRRYSVLLRFHPRFRDDIDEIRNLLVDTPGGQLVPLSEIAAIEQGAGPEEIFRENMERRKVIVLNVAGRDVGGFVAEARERIAAEVDLPPGYRVRFGGQFENQQQASRQLLVYSLLIALAVFIILISSFGSLRQSLLILLNVPVALAGGVAALWAAGATLNVSSAVGFIALFGISLQNGIILVKTINTLRERDGLPLREAVVEGSKVRLRPILMTELVMIFGALPLVLGSAMGSEIHRPLAVVYVGGFLIALLFSKFTLPALYCALESRGRDGDAGLRRHLVKEKI